MDFLKGTSREDWFSSSARTKTSETILHRDIPYVILNGATQNSKLFHPAYSSSQSGSL